MPQRYAITVTCRYAIVAALIYENIIRAKQNMFTMRRGDIAASMTLSRERAAIPDVTALRWRDEMLCRCHTRRRDIAR